jgi:hypothetical protein
MRGRRVRTGAGVSLADVLTEYEGSGTALEEQDVPHVEERQAAEREEAPLVAGGGEGTEETGHDHDDIHEDDGEDVREREAGVEEELKEQEWRGDCPVDIAGILQVASAGNQRNGAGNNIPRLNESHRKPYHEGTRHGWRSHQGPRP